MNFNSYAVEVPNWLLSNLICATVVMNVCI
jgi:hypothetical protein